jgi:hypothetical protein
MILLKVFLLSWLITKFEPLKLLMDFISIKTVNNKLQIIYSIIHSIVYLMVTCLMCCNFWTALILTNDIYLSAASAFIGFWYHKLLGYYENFERL